MARAKRIANQDNHLNLTNDQGKNFKFYIYHKNFVDHLTNFYRIKYETSEGRVNSALNLAFFAHLDFWLIIVIFPFCYPFYFFKKRKFIKELKLALAKKYLPLNQAEENKLLMILKMYKLDHPDKANWIKNNNDKESVQNLEKNWFNT